MTPNTSMIYTTEIQFTAIPHIWCIVEISIQEGLDIIKTGLLRGQQVDRIKVLTITDSDNESTSFMYDITAAKSGAQSWSLL